jgi:hypothetical protein
MKVPQMKASKGSLRCDPIFLSSPEIDVNAPSSKMQTQGQAVGFMEAPSAPPMPWRLLGSKLCREDSDERLDGDDVSTSASSGEKEQNGSDHGYVDQDAIDNDGIEKVQKLDLEINDDGVYTLMIKHIPCRCTHQEVVDAIVEIGFGESYNFFYLPIRRGHEQNFGYAFIGFLDAELTNMFADAITGYRFTSRNSNKACEVAPARIQGFSSNVEHFQKMRCTRRKTRAALTMCV